MCILVPRIRRRTTGMVEADLNRLVLKRKRAKAGNDLNAECEHHRVIINLHRDLRAAGATQMSAPSPRRSSLIRSDRFRMACEMLNNR